MSMGARDQAISNDHPFDDRSQERFFVSRRQIRRLTATGLMLIALCLSIVAAPVAAQDQRDAASKAVEWLLTQQRSDGGFAGFSSESDPGATVDAVLALAAADHLGIETDTRAAIDYLKSQARCLPSKRPDRRPSWRWRSPPPAMTRMISKM